MPNDDVSLLADIADIEGRINKAKHNKNYDLIEMLEDRLANRKRQLKKLRQLRS